MQALADFIARHAIAVLIAVEIVLLLATAILWRLVQRYAPVCWRIVLDVWTWLAGTTAAARARQLPVVGRALSRTLGALRYLGVFATLAFVAAAVAIVGFFELVDEIEVGESLAGFDVALSAALRRELPNETVRAFAAITHLGDVTVLMGVGACVGAVLLVLRRWTLAAAWAVATISGGLLNSVLKGIFERTRPLHDHGLVSEMSWSFPSGHASGSMLVYGLLGYIIVRHTRPAWHIPVALACLTLIVFVGSSRVLLQVHYLSDVLAGYASAAAWVTLWIAGLEANRAWR
jgi:membrane-associated phospholipid phosphatase